MNPQLVLNRAVFSSVIRWVALVLVLTAALALRTCELSRRPMHADEANQAVKTGELLETGRYTFDPHDHHGPTLYYFGALAARLRSERTLTELQETTVRLVPALFGVASVLLVACLIQVGARDAPASVEDLTGAAFFAVCPAVVYYSRYYIHETLLLAFVLLTILALAQWFRSRRLGWSVVAGIAAGCALATKETALLYFVAAGLATWVTAKTNRLQAGSYTMCSRDLLIVVVMAAFVAAAFYSSFGRNFGGLRDALVAPLAGLERATGPTGHEKPWWYYLGLLTWQRNGGLVWQQALLGALALIGAVAGWRRTHVRWALVYTVTVLIALSAVPYKTPWNIIHVVPGLAALAAAGIAAIATLRTGRLVAAAFTFLTLATLVAQSYRAAFRYGADARNPYAYVHSVPDVTKFRALVERALADDDTQPVRIISPEYWPLPWYLRGLPRIGYWSVPPAICDGALVITAADLGADVRSRLHGNYREQFLGLRPGFTMLLFVSERKP